VIALGIPIILLISGSLAKKLVRGSKWERFDFFLGVEFTLAALSSALIHIFDLVKNASMQYQVDVMKNITATAVFIAWTFFMLLVVLSTHQDWIKRNGNPNGQIVWLGIIANLVGASLLSAFILFVKGI
jgi:hypothetical protein